MITNNSFINNDTASHPENLFSCTFHGTYVCMYTLYLIYNVYIWFYLCEFISEDISEDTVALNNKLY